MENISRRKFKKQQQQANEDISKIFNPENAFKKKQKKIIKDIFG